MKNCTLIHRIVICAGLAFSCPITAHAFGTIDSPSQDLEHEKITRLALASEGFEPETLDSLAGKRFSFGAVGSPDHRLVLSPTAHCDGGDHLSSQDYAQSKQDAQAALMKCRSRLFRNLDSAIYAAGDLLDSNGKIRGSQIPTYIACRYTGVGGRAKCNVLEGLGLALHAAQDFYAHTNWSDAAKPGAAGIDNPPGQLCDGKACEGPAGWLNPRLKEALNDGLISGCFGLRPSTCKGRVEHAALNKDNGEIDLATGQIGKGLTPRGAHNGNFKRAASAAIADTRDKWRYVRARIIELNGETKGNRMICAILKDDPITDCP